MQGLIDYIKDPNRSIPVIISAVSAFWLYFTQRRLKRLEAALARQQKEHESHLQRTNHIHNTVFSGIYAKQAEAIAEVYGTLCDVEDVLHTLFVRFVMDKSPIAEDLSKAAAQSVLDAKRSVDRRRIYFSSDLNSALSEFLHHAQGMAFAPNEFLLKMRDPSGKMTSESEFCQHFPKLQDSMKLLRMEFQKVLGVNTLSQLSDPLGLKIPQR